MQMGGEEGREGGVGEVRTGPNSVIKIV